MTLIQTSTEVLPGLSQVDMINTLQSFSFRFLIDIVSVFILIRLVYYRVYKRSELFFTFFIFNITIFLICFLLNKVELSMGAAFGLFAVFSMLRYRTEDISIKDMSYLFLVIAIGLITGVTKTTGTFTGYEYLFLGLINFIIIVFTFLLETNIFFKKEAVKLINYENIALVNTAKEAELIEDIKKRTGINVHRISVTKIDFLNDTAQIKIYYYEN